MKKLIVPLEIKLRILRNKLVEKKQYNAWLKKGKPLPPPHLVKQNLLKSYKDKHKLNILIETGTYLGDMVYAQRNNFNSIYSIEIQSFLYEAAKRRFKNFKHINILKGDSGKVLNEIMPKINEPALIWLDGHYSGGITGKSDINCPIYSELGAIFSTPNDNVILIDDANCFDGTNDYPTYENLEKFLKKYNYKTAIYNNAIVCEKL